MLRIKYSYWDGVSWCRRHGEVIVTDLNQWKEWIDNKIPQEYRMDPENPNEDSLKVEIEKVTDLVISLYEETGEG